MMQKKGLSYDVAVVAVVLFTFSIVFIVSIFIYNQVASGMQNNTIINQSKATVDVLEQGKVTINRLDYIFFILFIGMMFSIVISSFFIPANSIFAFMYFIGLVVIVAVSSILSYTFGKITESGYFNSIAVTNLPITSNIMGNLPMYVTIVGFIAMVLLYAKPQQGY